MRSTFGHGQRPNLLAMLITRRSPNGWRPKRPKGRRMSLTDEQQAIKDEFLRVRKTWSPVWEQILELDPEFLEAYLEFSAVPWRDGGALDPKVKEFIYIAVDAAATHLYEPGIRQH